MDLVNANQVFGVILFFAGIAILTFCRRYERELDEKLKDPKVRWAVIDGNKNSLLKQKSTRGTIMALLGLGVAMYGFILFLTNIK